MPPMDAEPAAENASEDTTARSLANATARGTTRRGWTHSSCAGRLANLRMTTIPTARSSERYSTHRRTAMARSPSPGEVWAVSTEPPAGVTPTPNWNEPRTEWPSRVLTDTQSTV